MIKKKITISALLLVLSWPVICLHPPFAGAEDIINIQNRKSEYPMPVPDTGQIRCYDTLVEIPCQVPGEPFFGQDGNYSGNAANYQLISQDQEEIENSNDLSTGLPRQLLAVAKQMSWREAFDYTDKLEFAGYSDWRLPGRQELLNILSYGTTPAPLPGLSSTGEQKTCAWTLSPGYFSRPDAKTICPGNSGQLSDKYQKKVVYALRGQARDQRQYINNGNGTALDKITGLMWQTTEVRAQNWKQALVYCEKLDLGGFSDWRLPTIKELSSLVNENRTNPAIDPTFFPAARSSAYWTSTTFAGHPGFAWCIHFDKGLEYNGGYKGRRYYVRAVRGGIVSLASLKSHSPPPPIDLIPKRKEVPDNDKRIHYQPYPLDLQLLKSK